MRSPCFVKHAETARLMFRTALSPVASTNLVPSIRVRWESGRPQALRVPAGFSATEACIAQLCV